MVKNKKEVEGTQHPLEDRVKNAGNEIKETLGRYNLALAAEALFTKDGRITARPVLVDIVEEAPKVETA